MLLDLGNSGRDKQQHDDHRYGNAGGTFLAAANLLPQKLGDCLGIACRLPGLRDHLSGLL